MTAPPVSDPRESAKGAPKRPRRGAKKPLPELDPHVKRQLISDPVPAKPPPPGKKP